jgi:hypothetical protein
MAAKWTAADLPDQSGQTVVVTGASSGLGKIVATGLARAGANVVLAVRDVAKGRAAAETMSGRTEVRPLDLASLASVRAFAAGWAGDLDVLINNAGIMQVPHGLTQDGFELQMGTNHLGPFALTALLLPHLRDRVVTVSSQLQSGGHLHLDDLNGERRPYNALQAYFPGGSLRRAAPCAPSPPTRASPAPAWPHTSAAQPASFRNWPCACSTTPPCRPCTPPRPASLPAPTSPPTASSTCAGTPK